MILTIEYLLYCFGVKNIIKLEIFLFNIYF